MTIIEINKKLYTFPENWNELSSGQAKQVMEIMCGPYQPEQLVMGFLRVLSGCNWWNFLRAKTEELEQYLYLTYFLWEKNDLTKNLLPQYRGLYGPAGNFDNLRMNEFAFAENFFLAYSEDQKNEEALNKLIATLYRPKIFLYNKDVNLKSDPRKDFNEGRMVYHTKKVAKWPRHIKELVYKWYGGCREQLVKDYPEIFSGGSGEPALHGLVSTMRNVAKEGTYGDFEKVEMMYVKLFMIELKESKHESDQMNKNSAL